MKKEYAITWMERTNPTDDKCPSNHVLCSEQKNFHELFHKLFDNKNRLDEKWDIYCSRDPYKRKALQINLTAEGSKISDIIRKDFIDSRVHNNKYKDKPEDWTQQFEYDTSYNFNLEDLKKCEECGGLIMATDEIRSERFCANCGLVQESYIPEMIQYQSYKGPSDEDNLGRNGDYGDSYTPKNWKKPRNKTNRPYYKGQIDHDRLIDTQSAKNKVISQFNYEKKILKPRVKKEGFGSESYSWWELRRRRPPKKRKNETEEQRIERQKAERDKKRIQRLNDNFTIADIYITENGLPGWVRRELKHILKQIPKKFSMTNIHSRLPTEKIIIGIVLYIMKRAGELDHPIFKEALVLSIKELDTIFNNLNKLLDDSQVLYDDSSTY